MIIDFHSHILPYLDDGARNMEEALSMARIAVDSGVEVMLATPHSNQKGLYENYATSRMQEIFLQLQEELRWEKIPLTVLPGMEIMASQDVLSLIKRRKLCSLAGTELFLIEFPFPCLGEQMKYLLQGMISEGYVPVLAHPERYYCIQDDMEWLMHFQEMGCYIQINKGSVFDRFGPRSGETVRRMLELGLVDVVGSDAHGSRRRTPEMGEFRQYLTERYGETMAKTLLERNPQRLLGLEEKKR